LRNRFYLITRDLHLHAGLFISPFIIVFAISVFYLVHAWSPGQSPWASAPSRKVSNLKLPADIENLGGRARVDGVRSILDQIGIQGEIGFIRHIPKAKQLVVPVSIPGSQTVVTIDLATRSAAISERQTGLADALVLLHKSPGPHLVDIRMNWLPMFVWRFLADGTVYLLLFITASGIYLWAVLRSERRIGFALLTLGAFSFFGVVYAFVR